jgi:hypothetical protein
MIDAEIKRETAARMRAIHNQRVTNLRALAQHCGGFTHLARDTGYALTQLIRLAGPGRSRQIGETLARGIEVAMKLPTGWLDEEH